MRGGSISHDVLAQVVGQGTGLSGIVIQGELGCWCPDAGGFAIARTASNEKHITSSMFKERDIGHLD
jgi:hypothetical protein